MTRARYQQEIGDINVSPGDGAGKVTAATNEVNWMFGNPVNKVTVIGTNIVFNRNDDTHGSLTHLAGTESTFVGTYPNGSNQGRIKAWRKNPASDTLQQTSEGSTSMGSVGGVIFNTAFQNKVLITSNSSAELWEVGDFNLTQVVGSTSIGSAFSVIPVNDIGQLPTDFLGINTSGDFNLFNVTASAIQGGSGMTAISGITIGSFTDQAIVLPIKSDRCAVVFVDANGAGTNQSTFRSYLLDIDLGGGTVVKNPGQSNIDSGGTSNETHFDRQNMRWKKRTPLWFPDEGVAGKIRNFFTYETLTGGIFRIINAVLEYDVNDDTISWTHPSAFSDQIPEEALWDEQATQGTNNFTWPSAPDLRIGGRAYGNSSTEEVILDMVLYNDDMSFIKNNASGKLPSGSSFTQITADPIIESLQFNADASFGMFLGKSNTDNMFATLVRMDG